MKLEAWGHATALDQRVIGRIATADCPATRRQDAVLLLHGDDRVSRGDVEGYQALLTPLPVLPTWARGMAAMRAVEGLEYLEPGDVVLLTPAGFVRVLYRRRSDQNFLLVAENCNSYCLMCSQPPRPSHDIARVHEHVRLIDLIDPETRELGLTGGEPTLLRDHFLKLIEHCKSRLPRTALHVLTNGRLFFYRKFAQRLGAIAHPDLMLGIPLYSDVDCEHDYVVQATRAFDQTVIGLYHLARYEVPVEIRVVLHRQTYRRLPALAEFIARNFPFAAQVALMGLEVTGLTLAHPDELWIDPAEYQDELKAAAEHLHAAGLHVRLYNHQLCVLDRCLWRFTVRSISDWKREYLPCCESCSLRHECGGVFATSHGRHSAHISPFGRIDDGERDSPRPRPSGSSGAPKVADGAYSRDRTPL